MSARTTEKNYIPKHSHNSNNAIHRADIVDNDDDDNTNSFDAITYYFLYVS